MKTAEIGRVKKIRKLPLERRRDWRRFVSTIGPRTKARTNGGGSNSNFLKRYPNNPKIIMTSTSKVLFLTLKVPIMQKSNMSGKRILWGTFRTCTHKGMRGRLRINSITFPIYILLITPQNKSGCSFKS